jgi:hypothetical protein
VTTALQAATPQHHIVEYVDGQQHFQYTEHKAHGYKLPFLLQNHDTVPGWGGGPKRRVCSMLALAGADSPTHRAKHPPVSFCLFWKDFGCCLFQLLLQRLQSCHTPCCQLQT